MQFYASNEYLNVAAQAYFPGRGTSIELVRIGGKVFRLLVIDGRKPVSDLNFVDYLEPLDSYDPSAPLREGSYARSVVRRIVEASEWESERHDELQPAPFVDWSRFDGFEDYEAFLESRSKRLYKEQQRRGRRLAELFGDLSFKMNDPGDDVMPLAFKWKVQQFRDTGAPNYLADSRNRRYFELLREHGLLTASTLRGDGRLLSVWLGFVHEGVWSGWIFSYDKDPALQKFSLGHQLLHRMLKESKRLGHREFDFSIGDEDYKWFYSTHVRVLGPAGSPPLAIRASAAIRQAKRRTKDALGRHPALLRGATALAETLRSQKNRLRERAQHWKETLVRGGSGRTGATQEASHRASGAARTDPDDQQG